MPIYEFQCEKCECVAEKVQAIGDESPTCPQCDGVTVKKPSPIAFFKMKGMGGYPSLRKAYQRGGGDLTTPKERARAEENRLRGFRDLG